MTRPRGGAAVSSRQPGLVAVPLLPRRRHPCGDRKDPCRQPGRTAAPGTAHPGNWRRQDRHCDQPAVAPESGGTTAEAGLYSSATATSFASRPYTKLKAAFGDNARIVKAERGGNAAQNARVHVATYQTLGLDDEEGFASFLTEHYGEDAFSVIIIDECHRSAWGTLVRSAATQSQCLIHIGLTATPRKLEESDKASPRRQRDHRQQPPVFRRARSTSTR